MAKEYNLKTGKEKEISTEDFAKATQSGNGIISRIITSQDGSKKEDAIWGGYKLDGYDRTLNVFIKMEDASHFAQMLVEGKLDNLNITDPCKNELGYQINVDYTDTSVTSILRAGEGKVELNTYVRDERKTFRTTDLFSKYTGIVKLDENDNFPVGDYDLKKDQYVFIMLCILGLRKYLLKENVVQELYNMYDETVGVNVKVGKAGTVTYNIVKGMKRPDLPCNVFLLGEQICRPYIDELLGIKPTGEKRVHWTPELAEKFKEASKEQAKAAAEKKAKEEEKQKKAEAERKKKEAEKKSKAAAEKKKKEAEKKAKAEAEKKAKEEERRRLAEELLKEKNEQIERNKILVPEKREYYKYASGLIGLSSVAMACANPMGNVNAYVYSTFGSDFGSNTSRFTNIKKVVCTKDGVVGLRNDGTCIATSPTTNPFMTYAYISDCNSWNNIVDISAGEHQVIGLREDGTCVANRIKWNIYYGYDGQCEVGWWKNIKKVVCASNHTIGVKNDGSVVLACTNDYCKIKDVSTWTNVDLLASESTGAVALTNSGELISCGRVEKERLKPEKGILQLVLCNGVAYALYLDGTVGTGSETNGSKIKEKNVIALGSTGWAVVVLTEDGNVHSYGSRSWEKLPEGIRLFESYDNIIIAMKQEEQRRKEEELTRASRRDAGVCQYCGGNFKKGLFSTKCISCGKTKDY